MQNAQTLLKLVLLTGILPAAVAIDAAAALADQAAVSEASAGIAANEIPLLSELQQPATSVEAWAAQIAQAERVQVTGVRVETIDGLAVVLETATGQLEVPTTNAIGNALIADIPNAVLALPNGEAFEQADPIAGIALVSVTSLPGDRVRVAITGVDAPPTANINRADQGLVVNVNQGEALAGANEEAIEIVVTGEQDEGYNPSSATTATRTDTPLRDIPASIQVIPRQVLEDQQVTRLQDALQNVSGITRRGNFGGAESGAYTIRGFIQDETFRNGFRNDDFYSVSETANIERIEVLRGPASVLFGQSQPGGLINIVTEQPLRQPRYEVSFEGGGFDFYRPTIDFSSPLNTDGSLRYRLNAAYQDAGSFRDFVNTERIFIAPVLAWDLSESTTLTIDFEYLYNDPVFDRGLVALDDGSLVLPIDRFLGYPSLDDYTETTLRGGYTLEHRFSENWRIRNALSIYSSRVSGNQTGTAGNLIDNRFSPRDLDSYDFLRENYALQTEAVGSFNTGSIDHELLLGVELNRRTRYIDFYSASLPPIDIFDPDYEVDRPDRFNLVFAENSATDTFGVYLQDQIDLFDNLILLLGGRFDAVEQTNYDALSGTRTEQSNSAFSPRVGIVYHPSEEISLYASYSQSFFPNAGLSADNSTFDPERGRQFEVGIKGEFLDGRLSATLAAFDLTRSNILTTDPDDENFSIAVGKQRSQGIEFDVAGEILSGWNIIAGFALIDARVTEDNSIPIGDRPESSARNTANLWTTYEIQSGDLEGLGFGLGVFFTGEREGELPNSNFELPGFVRTDAALFYRRDNWQAALNIRNLFDIEYYETSQFRDIVYPGAPFNVTASVSFTF